MSGTVVIDMRYDSPGVGVPILIELQETLAFLIDHIRRAKGTKEHLYHD